MYILQVVDGGILRLTVPGFDLVKLAEIAEELIGNYLLANGFKEEGDMALKTDDGYAVIQHVPGHFSELRTDLWTYSFDGQEEVAESLSVIYRQLLKMNCDIFVVPSNFLQLKVREAVSSWLGANSFDETDLADNILKRLTGSYSSYPGTGDEKLCTTTL